jgi:hypothetical protein
MLLPAVLPRLWSASGNIRSLNNGRLAIATLAEDSAERALRKEFVALFIQVRTAISLPELTHNLSRASAIRVTLSRSEGQEHARQKRYESQFSARA